MAHIDPEEPMLSLAIGAVLEQAAEIEDLLPRLMRRLFARDPDLLRIGGLAEEDLHLRERWG